MSAGSSHPPRRTGSKPKAGVRAKSGCYTCRIRRKKCDEKPDAEGSCQTCVRLRLQCLGFGAKRPDWMREGNSVVEMREKIKSFLAHNGMIKGHSAAASLHASEQSPQAGTSASARATSGPSIVLPPLHSGNSQDTTDLNTPLSATSTLTPEDRSASPPSPSTSHGSSHSYANSRLFPPGYSDASTRTHYDQTMSSPDSGMRQDQTLGSSSGVLHLSNGRPLPSRTHTYVSPSRRSRRSPPSDAYGESSPGNGLGLMIDSSGPLGVNGNGTINSNSTTRYGHSSTSLHFPRPDSTTTSAHGRFSPPSYAPVPSRFPSGVSASSSSYFDTSFSTHSYSRTPSTVNSTLNAMNASSPTRASASSASSSPSMLSNNTPYTPFTPLPVLPSFPPGNDKSAGDMDWTPASATAPSRMLMGPIGTPLLSPTSDTGPSGFGVDGMDMRWTSDYPYAQSGMQRADGHNNTTGSNGVDVLVKSEPDTTGLDTGAADGSNTYAYNSYGATTPLRTGSSTHDGCATPVANTFTNSTSDPANNAFATHSSMYNNNNAHHYLYNCLPYSSSAKPNSMYNLGASTSMDVRGTTMYPPYATTGDSSYPREPELSPDSPRAPHRADPIIGVCTPTSYMGGQGHGAGNAYTSIAHHPPGQFGPLSVHARHGGGGHGGLSSTGQSYGAGHGYGHAQPSSSWAADDQVPLTGQQQHQDLLLHQQQPSQALMPPQPPYVWIQGNNSNDSGTLQFPNASPTVRRTDLPPPLQSSFSPHYYPAYLGEFAMTEFDTLAAQQAPMNPMANSGIGDGVVVPYYTPAPISNEDDFFHSCQEQQQQMYQEYAPTRSLQPALVDPRYVDRADGSLVEHYLSFVRPVQYFFLDERVVDLLRGLAFSNEAVRNAICSVASVHKRRMREGGIPLLGNSPSNSPNRTSLALIQASTPHIPEGDDDNGYYNSIYTSLKKMGPERLTKAEAMAGLQCISSFLFQGGVGGWDFFLTVACNWVESVLSQQQSEAGDAYLLQSLAQLKCTDELGTFIVRTTMWFEVLASVTMVRTPRFLEVYRKLFPSDSARIVEIDGEASRSEPEFSMLEVMGCDNLTFLALAEISALAAWKEEETKKQTLSYMELVKRGSDIEQRCLRAITEAGTNWYPDGSTSQADSLENRRRLTADIFRASARLFLYNVLNGDRPSVREIREGVTETINALKRVPLEPKPLRRSVVRSVVLPICLAGCMTDDKNERATLKQFLEGEGGAGNCGSVVAVMETVWERRDAKNKRGRGGRRTAVPAEHVTDISWREVLRERGGGVPILLV